MRVLFVNHTGLVSGAEHSLLTLIDGLPPEVVAGLACPAGPLAEMARERGVEVCVVQGTTGSLRLNPRRTPVALAEIALSRIQVAQAARRSGTSIVHANGLRAGLMVGMARGNGLVTHVRDCLPDSAATRLIRRLIAWESDALVAISTYVADCFRAGITDFKKPLEVIDNPVDLDRFRIESRPDKSDPESLRPLLAIVGQISPWKGHDTAIRALYELRKNHPQARLLIVGEVKFADLDTRFDNRSYLEVLHRLVQELELKDAVEFLGERSDIPQIMRRADAVLVPSTEEPFGRTVAEAMAVGTPVIATSVGGPAELIEDDRTGLLVPPGEPVAWSRAIRRVVEHPDQAIKMSERAAHVARRRFAVQRHVEAMMNVYEAIGYVSK